MSNSDYPSYINENGKTVSGTAAGLKVVADNGGWIQHHTLFAEDVLKTHARLSAETSQTLKPKEQRIRRVK